VNSIPAQDSVETRVQAARVIAAGGVIAFRTDTFYGLGADPFNREALRRVNGLKGRDGGKPILIVISDASEAERFIAHRTPLFNSVSARFWPGALTIIVTAKPQVPQELTAGSMTIGMRLPDDEIVRSLIRACGGALTATSANLAGESPARTAVEVASAFPKGLDLIIDGGAALSDQPSTVIDLSGERTRLIREGVVSRRELQEYLRAVGEDI
jgi:L-threonylcarbamoyladenylate synthase